LTHDALEHTPRQATHQTHHTNDYCRPMHHSLCAATGCRTHTPLHPRLVQRASPATRLFSGLVAQRTLATRARSARGQPPAPTLPARSALQAAAPLAPRPPPKPTAQVRAALRCFLAVSFSQRRRCDHAFVCVTTAAAASLSTRLPAAQRCCAGCEHTTLTRMHDLSTTLPPNLCCDAP
jgi:hypothetical protein